MPNRLFAIDPGTTESALVVLSCDTGRPLIGFIAENDVVLDELTSGVDDGDQVAIEMVASYGMPVGVEVFDTCVWIGRFVQAVAPLSVQLVTRQQVKMALCHTIKGVNDAAIRQRLIDWYGPGKAVAIGTKAKPGPLYGIKSHMWPALAVGVAVLQQSPLGGDRAAGGLTGGGGAVVLGDGE